MRILVTGALGFVGVNLVKRFASDGADVVALDIHSPDDQARWFLASESSHITHVVADVREAAWDRCLGGAAFDVVVHAAAVTPLAPGQEAAHAVRAIGVNVGGTARVLTWAANARPGRVLFVSSGSVYGTGDSSPALEETAPHDPDNVYAISKSASERLALRLGELADVAVLAVRLTQPYGPMERATISRSALSPIHDWCEALVTGAPLVVGNLDLGRDYAYIDDVVDAIVTLAELPAPQQRIYNISTGVNITLGQVLDELRTIAPGFETRRGTPNLTRAMARPPLAIDRLTTETGWRPRHTLRSGLGAYLEWLRHRHPRQASATGAQRDS